jgi:hypothetical protein
MLAGTRVKTQEHVASVKSCKKPVYQRLLLVLDIIQHQRTESPIRPC